MSGPRATANLFNKTELFIGGLVLKNVRLESVSRAVAEVLRIEPDKVLVVDAHSDLVTLDILQQSLDLENIVGREGHILRALSRIEGLTVTDRARVHSEGVLGFVGLESVSGEELARSVDQTRAAISERISRRCLVFPTGGELIAGNIVDTNTPHMVSALEEAGFSARAGEVLPDDEDMAFGRLNEAAMQGFGVVVTTGGTGAERKDCIVEAILKLDPAAATPYTVRFTRGQGRHHKDGVRIAVGQRDLTTFVALTGPHREVVQVTPVLIQGLTEGWDKRRLAVSIAELLRANF